MITLTIKIPSLKDKLLSINKVLLIFLKVINTIFYTYLDFPSLFRKYFCPVTFAELMA